MPGGGFSSRRTSDVRRTCPFYLPKQSSAGRLLAVKDGIEQMLEQLDLTDDERQALEGDRDAVAALAERLADTPTPAGPTPNELGYRTRSSPSPPSATASTEVTRSRHAISESRSRPRLDLAAKAQQEVEQGLSLLTYLERDPRLGDLPPNVQF